MSVTASARDAVTARCRVMGMGCAACATKIEKAVRSVGVEDVKVSTATQIMTLHVHDPDARLPEVKRAVTGIGYKLDRLDAPSVDTEIGRASGRERGWQYGVISVVAVSLKKKK